MTCFILRANAGAYLYEKAYLTHFSTSVINYAWLRQPVLVSKSSFLFPPHLREHGIHLPGNTGFGHISLWALQSHTAFPQRPFNHIRVSSFHPAFKHEKSMPQVTTAPVAWLSANQAHVTDRTPSKA